MTDETLALPAPEQPKLLPAPEQPLLLPPPVKAPPAGSGGQHDDPRRRRKIILIVLAILVVLILVGWFFHHRREAQAKEATERERDRLPVVSTIVVAASPPTADLRLPATISPLTEASLFARASGYLKARYVDIGDTVHKGQVLAEIDAPDLDQQVAGARQQLAQARSAVNDAKARVDLSRVTYLRLQTLVKDEAVAQQQVDQAKQDLDTANANLASSNANVGASQANLGRLVVLQDYEKLRAPFDGVVTARSVDVGALVNGSGASSGQSGTSGVASTSASTTSSGSTSTGASSTSSMSSGSGGGDTQSGGGSATELFRIAQDDRVRVFVTVPQENAASLEPDNQASVFVQGFDAAFEGRVTRTSRSLDPTARTLLVEVQVPNPRRQLVTGMYAQVRFQSPRRGTPILIPGEAVIARADGLHVAVVEDLRPEDRDRLPKRQPKSDDQDDKKKGDSKEGGGSSKGKGKQDDKGSGGAQGDSKKGQKEDDKGGGQSGGGGDDDADAKDDDPANAKRVHLQEVEVGRDYGTEIEITRGLRAGMTVIANPGDEVAEDALVMPHARKPKPDSGGGSASKGAGGSGAASKGPDGQGHNANPTPDNGQGGETKLDSNAPPGGNGSPSMASPTKGRK